jgi:anti-sigma factor RsiW
VNCTSSEQQFEAYLDNTLIPVRRASLLAHLGTCGRCKGILDELRVVDALLASPREIELPENFTFATMAEVRSMPKPHVSHAPAPVVAYLVSFLVAAWLLIGAAFVFGGPGMRVAGETALGVSIEALRTLGAIGHAGLHVAGDLGGLGNWVASAAAIDIAAALILVTAVMRRRAAAERARS